MHYVALVAAKHVILVGDFSNMGMNRSMNGLLKDVQTVVWSITICPALLGLARHTHRMPSVPLTCPRYLELW